MDPNISGHSSVNSVDTDVLLKIPNNYFDPNFGEKTHISTDQDFMREIDRFLVKEGVRSVQNSTMRDESSYTSFVDSLKSLSVDKTTTNGHQEDLNLAEEKLKRQHYEQLCGLLQRKIQQYQQKVVGLARTCHEQELMLDRLRHNEGLDVENKRLSQKVLNLEKEVTETIALINKFQVKNDTLELKIEGLTMNSAEMRELSKKQIVELEGRLLDSQMSDERHLQELEKLRKQCDEIPDMKAEIKQLKDDKFKLEEMHETEQRVIQMKQKKIFNNMMDEFTEKEKQLLKELDMQRAALKNYYESQLETALEDKVNEFQQQVEQFQEGLQRESDAREKQLTDKAIKQIELIVKKNEEELDLHQRKHAEEIELYRMQLLNATRTVESLESKLSEFQVRRHDIAENLHTIMETQWKKTLEVLTNPSNKRYQVDDVESIAPSESDNNHLQNNNNMMMQSKSRTNNLSKSEENLKAELLRNYIDKLLKQSPKHDRVIDESNSQQISTMSSHKSKNTASKPWK